jgi:hypothetical protein
MQRIEARAAIEAMEGEEFGPVAKRINDRLTQKVKAVLKGSEGDERNRGWIEALEWVRSMPKKLREEIAQGQHDGEDASPEDD